MNQVPVPGYLFDLWYIDLENLGNSVYSQTLPKCISLNLQKYEHVGDQDGCYAGTAGIHNNFH